jgi:hypothetical protein
MKAKIGLRYLVYIILITFIVYLWDFMYEKIMMYFVDKHTFNPNLIIILSLTFYMLFGLFLGLDYFINVRKKEGKWKINYTKLILMALPSLYFSVSYFIYNSHSKFIHNILAYPIWTLIRGNVNFTNVVSVFQVTLGYVLITSFYKSID